MAGAEHTVAAALLTELLPPTGRGRGWLLVITGLRRPALCAQ